MLCHCGKALIEIPCDGIWKYFIFNAHCTNCMNSVWNCRICNKPINARGDSVTNLLSHLFSRHQFKMSTHILRLKSDVRYENRLNYYALEAGGILHDITQYIYDNGYLMFVCKDDKITHSCGYDKKHGDGWRQPPIELMRELKSGDACCAGCGMEFDSFPDKALYISHLANCPAMQH